MMKAKLLCLCLAAMLLVCCTALAAPRYPEKNGYATDGAAVLSKKTMDDLNAYSKLLEKEAELGLYVATVDFLDGEGLESYAAGLREKWQLKDDDLLLLLAVGEDKFGLWGGEKINRRLSESVQQKLLSAHLHGPFMRQDYDGAINACMPALNDEIGKAFDKAIALDGLFGTVTAPDRNWADWAEDWSARMRENKASPAPERTVRERVTDEDEDTGFSLGKVILTLFLLSVIFGKKPRARRGCGCGCAPFSSLLAALGLYKLWDKD